MPLKAIWANSTAYSKLLLTAGIVLIGLVVFTLLSMLAVAVIFHVNPVQLQEEMSNFTNPRTISILKFIQCFSEIGAFIIPALLIAFLVDQRPMNFLSINKGIGLYSGLLVILALIFALPLINYLGDLNSHMSLPSFLSGIEKWMKDSENKTAELIKRFLDMNSISDLLFNVFMIALLPAIGEELIFRGILQRIFSEWTKSIHLGIWISAILFSAMHFQFYGFLPRMLLGALLGYLLVWSGSLWLPILAHFVNNASAVIFTYLFKEEMISMDADKIGTEKDYPLILTSLVVMSALLWLVYKKERAGKEKVSLQ